MDYKKVEFPRQELNMTSRSDLATITLFIQPASTKPLFSTLSKMIAAAILLSTTLAVASAMPTAPETHSFKKRWEDGVDCTTDLVDRSTPGLLFAVASDGTAVYCDEIHEVSTEGWYEHPELTPFLRVLN